MDYREILGASTKTNSNSELNLKGLKPKYDCRAVYFTSTNFWVDGKKHLLFDT